MALPLDQAHRTDSPYRWVILAMVTLSGFIVMGFPNDRAVRHVQ